MFVPAERFRTEGRVYFENGVKWIVPENLFEASRKCPCRILRLGRRNVLCGFVQGAICSEELHIKFAALDVHITGYEERILLGKEETLNPEKHDTHSDLYQCCNLGRGRKRGSRAGHRQCCPQTLKTRLEFGLFK